MPPALDKQSSALHPPNRFVGIDVGAETIKVVELLARDGILVRGRTTVIEHHKHPGPALLEALAGWDWSTVSGAAVSGRLSRAVRLPRIPTKQAQARGFRFLFDDQPATVVNIGSHGFSVLELRAGGLEVLRENSRCSQGTGNFLRQLTERFNLTPAQASELCAEVEKAAPLSGRCPVILKTDMTHLANKGGDRAAILAGLFDAVCENVMVLVKPGISPARVALFGGVTQSRRIRRTLTAMLSTQQMELLPVPEDEAVLLEATGCAVLAAESPEPVPPLDQLLAAPPEARLDWTPPLRDALKQVRRMPPQPLAERNGRSRELLLGLDIGSTGSKAVALDGDSAEVVWEGYRRTAGDPVRAAQELVRRFVTEAGDAGKMRAVGVTGSGREIVGSLLTTCFGGEAVFVLNEIAAHAEGARHYDPRVDTIFEIGGQDAKYIRLAEGRVVDCAMNEACSAGTGSFIEEQGSKFAGIAGVAQLGAEALRAGRCASLGQHCSVFMAEVIDEAVAAGVEQPQIIAGLYDSIIQNYLHRVKGNRSVGAVIFCQGMPFASDALAAAVARQTGCEIIIPPNPGTVGALGIALLTRRETDWRAQPPLELPRFLDARIEASEPFICRATVGCGGAGNKCRINSIQTVVRGRRQRFNWGGACALYDKGTRKRKLPDRAPDPFREREALAQTLMAAFPARPGARTVALTDEFSLKGLLPFFATFLHGLGLDLKFSTGADHAVLKRGVQRANIPFCAPMQLYHGLADRMAEEPADFVFLPMLRGLTHAGQEPLAKVCPIVQASPWILRRDLEATLNGNVLSPVIDIGRGNYESPEFRRSCAALAKLAGVAAEAAWMATFTAAVAAQKQFEAECRAIGERALRFAAEQQLPAVVVLGRPYTIYNKVLNSNVPAILREQGALAIPVDCFPIAEETPVFDDIYWAQAQRILRAAHQVRRTPGVFAVYCSNYSCGPDSFNLHFFSYIMEGKPFAVIETDGHAGDAGTKTRIEAFLHCVAGEMKHSVAASRLPNHFAGIRPSEMTVRDIRPDETVLIPLLGPTPEVLAAALRGLGLRAETLPPVGPEALRAGRRVTSGKECVPMAMTLGALLHRVRSAGAEEKFVFTMPGGNGPCRFGVYNLLNALTLERTGLRDRARIWAPHERGYFDKLPPGFGLLVFTGFTVADALLEMLVEVRPVETRPGAADEIYQRANAELLLRMQAQAARPLGLARSLWEVSGGGLFGLRELVSSAAREFAAVRGDREIPTALVVGEIYVRSNPFANDHVVARLEERGLRARLVPCSEFVEYVDHVNRHDEGRNALGDRVSSGAQERVRRIVHGLVARELGGPARVRVRETLAAARDYVPEALQGEAVLTVGAALHHWRAGNIDAVVNVGPLECMPSKVAEAQFFHIARREGLPALTLALNGEPLNTETLDNFAFEVWERFRGRRDARAGGMSLVSPQGRGQTVGA
ncbi:MAG: BadF/BadG/BcrA/BcrD ATPase family protein [Limisphaerales bacterium]